MSIDSVYCILENGVVSIPRDNFTLPWLSRLVNDWFLYSFNNHKFNLTGKLFKSIIRVLNKKMSNGFLIDENIQTLTFSFENSEKTILENVR